jgi:hypothetical protein
MRIGGIERLRMTWLSTLPALVLALLPALAPTPAAARTAALVIGVDQYASAPDLEGAVADAVDIAASLRAVGADPVVLLRDAEVTREAIDRTWQQLRAITGPEDTLILSFAGHGIQIPDENDDEEDGFDEAYVLPGFKLKQSDRVNLLVDDDIAAMTVGTSATVILVADSCHSGTMLRAVDPRVGGRQVRGLPRSAAVGAEIAPTQKAATATSTIEFTNGLFLAAVPEYLAVEEVVIGGKPRGALSWGFARGLEGAADQNRDGLLSVGEMNVFIDQIVSTVADNRQRPQIYTSLSPSRPLFSLAVPRPQPDTALPPTTVPDIADPALRVAIIHDLGGDGTALLRRLSGIVLSNAAQADLIWDWQTGDVLTANGDIAARLGALRERRVLEGIIEKWRVLLALRERIDGSLSTRLLPDDSLHRDGALIALEIAATVGGPFVLFDLAADGTLVRILPRADEPTGIVRIDQVTTAPLRVGPPFGGDHLVVARLDHPEDLLGFLAERHGRSLDRSSSRGLLALLRQASVATGALYTTYGKP